MIDLTQVDELNVGGERVGELYLDGNKVWERPVYGMKLTALEAGSTVSITANGTPSSVDLRFKLNNGSLSTYTIGDTITLTNVGDYVLFTAGPNGNSTFSTGTSNYYQFSITGSVSTQNTIAYLLDDRAGKGSGISLPNYAFLRLFYNNDQPITNLDMSNVTTIGQKSAWGMCRGCTSLESVDLSSLTTIGTQGLRISFDECSSLTSIDVSSVTSVSGEQGLYCFVKACSSLQSLDLGNLESANGSESMTAIARNCTSLKSVNLKKLSSVGTNGLNQAFDGCTALEVVDFSEATDVPSITSSTFSNTNSTFQIVVPDALYSTWIAATNWSSLASQIVKVSDYTPAS